MDAGIPDSLSAYPETQFMRLEEFATYGGNQGEDCLRAELQRPAGTRVVREELPTYAGTGLQPGVDLTDSSALDDLMTGR